MKLESIFTMGINVLLKSGWRDLAQKGEGAELRCRGVGRWQAIEAL